jgi:hypothetical protein
MDARPPLPSRLINDREYCRISYRNLEPDFWYFLVADDEERLVKIICIESDGAVRVRVHKVRNIEDGINNADWVDDDDHLVFARSVIENRDESIDFYVVRTR